MRMRPATDERPPVTHRGRKIGEVTGLQADNYGIVISMRIDDEDMQQALSGRTDAFSLRPPEIEERIWISWWWIAGLVFLLGLAAGAVVF